MYDDLVVVLENRVLTGGHFLLSVHSPRQAVATRPGQFAMVRIPDGSDTLLRRPMSIYDVCATSGQNGKSEGGTPETIRFLYKVVGRGTGRMADLRPGERVGLLGPLGHGFFEEEYTSEARQVDGILHVAGGIGIAALLLPAKQISRAELKQRLFYGGRTKADLVLTEDFEPFMEECTLATEDGSKGHRGYITQPLGDFLERHREKRFLLMACGPWGMLRATAELARKYRQPCLVSMENRMGCGLGVCLGCCIRVDGEGHEAYQRVCTEGPVFRMEKVVWTEDSIPKT